METVLNYPIPKYIYIYIIIIINSWYHDGEPIHISIVNKIQIGDI